LIAGIGTDIVEIQRIRAIIKRRGHVFISRIFTIAEREYCSRANDSTVRFAGRFAAKEAVLKALGTGLRGVRWQDVEITRNDEGKPSVRLHGGAAQSAEKQGVTRIYLTISHSRDYAVAHAIAWQKGDGAHARRPAE
jgi:holo-[acyl-carrier protein] synthase